MRNGPNSSARDRCRGGCVRPAVPCCAAIDDHRIVCRPGHRTARHRGGHHGCRPHENSRHGHLHPRNRSGHHYGRIRRDAHRGHHDDRPDHDARNHRARHARNPHHDRIHRGAHHGHHRDGRPGHGCARRTPASAGVHQMTGLAASPVLGSPRHPTSPIRTEPTKPHRTHRRHRATTVEHASRPDADALRMPHRRPSTHHYFLQLGGHTRPGHDNHRRDTQTPVCQHRRQ